MFIQKQKQLVQTLRLKLVNKRVLQYTLWPVMPVVCGVIVLSVALYLQPAPAPTQLHSQRVSDTKHIIHHVATAPQVIQPLVTPKVPPAQPSSPSIAQVKTPTPVSTPKVEPVVTPSPSSNVSGLTPTTPSPTPASTSTPGAQVTGGYTSTNWSGYLATSGNFTAISGSWTATLATGNGSSISADSTWIGIGGVTSGDLIQTGTQNIIAANGQESTSAFYELLPGVSQTVPGVVVSPGDSISASVSEVSNEQWVISITDKTNNESYTTTVSYASSLSSAEWIEEDPSFSSRRLIPFDNFVGASFTNGLATINEVSVNIAATSAQPVIMVNTGGQSIAVPSIIGNSGASFTISP